MPYSFRKQAVQIVVRVGYRIVSTRGTVIAIKCRRLSAKSLFARMPEIESLREGEVCII